MIHIKPHPSGVSVGPAAARWPATVRPATASAPFRPAIVPPAELPLPAALAITTSVNGQVVRRGNTSQMIRSVAQLISEISRVITLGPGTLLLTGAPPPVSAQPMPGLRVGDEVCVEIEGVGQLVNTVAPGLTA